MNIQVKNWTLFLVALFAITAIFFLGGYIGRKTADNRSQATLDSLSKEIERYEIELKDTKVYVATVEQENMTLRQAKKEAVISREEMRKLYLKKVSDLTKAEMTISILRDSVKHNGKIITVYDTLYYVDPRKAIILPFSFKDSTRYYDFSGRFDKDGILSTSIQAPVKLNIYIGIDKKSKNDKVVVSSDNPYVRIDYLNSYKIDKPKPKTVGLGFQVGYGVTKGGLSPYVGVGLSYNLIRF